MRGVLLCAALAAAAPARAGDVGVIVMAHGGDPAWNAVVEKAAAPLEAERPTEIAWGMADADALQHAVFALEKKGVRRIAVVRLFLNGDSFLLRTRKILGLEPGAPAERPKGMPDMSAMHGMQGMADMRFMDPDKMPLWRVVTVSTFVVSHQGLMESPISPPIMAQRAVALSKDPSRESVLLIAHGVGDDKADARWRAAMRPAVEAVRKAAPFREVEALTLRDDWPAAHAKAVADIKAFVARAKKGGGRALIIPYRLYGFGPRESEIDGLGAATDDKGLLPSPLVGRWLVDEADRLVRDAGWER